MSNSSPLDGNDARSQTLGRGICTICRTKQESSAALRELDYVNPILTQLSDTVVANMGNDTPKECLCVMEA